MIIFTFIKLNSKNWFFLTLEYEGYYYFDNINSIMSFFLLLKNKEVCYNISEEMVTKKGFIYIMLIFISHIIDFFIILVFLETIESKFRAPKKILKKIKKIELITKLENLLNILEIIVRI